MSGLARAEKVKPCLLDRLTDEDPAAKTESRRDRVITPQRYLKGVLRDLRWLLNTATHLDSTPVGSTLDKSDAPPPRAAEKGGDDDPDGDTIPSKVLADYPEAYRSVFAFGIPDFCGVLKSRLDVRELAAKLEEILRRFEPRIDPRTLRVRVISSDDDPNVAEMLSPVVSFEIEGQLWMDPAPEHLRLRTTIDLETGYCALSSHAAQ